MAQSKIYIATPQDIQRFIEKDPTSVKSTLAQEGFKIQPLDIKHFLLHYLNEGDPRSSIFFDAGSVNREGTQQTLAELIGRYRPGPGLFFHPPYLALVQEDLYNSVRLQFSKLKWFVERL